MSKNIPSSLKIETVRSFEPSVNLCQTTRHHNSGGSSLHSHGCVNLESSITLLLITGAKRGPLMYGETTMR
jgi:hypothetical protein